jgi:hypothetical protein
MTLLTNVKGYTCKPYEYKSADRRIKVTLVICKSTAWICIKIFSVFFVENYDVLRLSCNLNSEEPPLTIQREGSSVRSRSPSC